MGYWAAVLSEDARAGAANIQVRARLHHPPLFFRRLCLRSETRLRTTVTHVMDAPAPAPVRTALVGCSGLAGRYFHAPHVAACPSLTLTTLVQRSAAPEPGLAEFAPGAALVHSLDAALNDGAPPVELVIIASPDATHAAYAAACLHAGRHVLVDKPFTQTLAEAEAVLGAAADAGGALLCMPFQNRRHDSDFLTVTRLLRDGALGTLREYRAHYDRFRPVVRPSAVRMVALIRHCVCGGRRALPDERTVARVRQRRALTPAVRLSIHPEARRSRPRGRSSTEARSRTSART